MSDGVYQDCSTRIDDLAVMVASDCVDMRSFYSEPYPNVASVFFDGGGGLIIRP